MLARSKRLPVNLIRRFTTSITDKTAAENKESSTPEAEELARRTAKIDFKSIKHETKVPRKPFDPPEQPEPGCPASPSQIDSKTIQLLERLSLVDLDSKEALKTLQDSIEFADKVAYIPTSGVEPLYTVLESHPLRLREDSVSDGNIKDDILKNARITEEDYFVAPPGNIPLEQQEKKFD